jgi:hypothetical protein
MLRFDFADGHRTSFANAIWYLALEAEKISYHVLELGTQGRTQDVGTRERRRHSTHGQ